MRIKKEMKFDRIEYNLKCKKCDAQVQYVTMSMLKRLSDYERRKQSSTLR